MILEKHDHSQSTEGTQAELQCPNGVEFQRGCGAPGHESDQTGLPAAQKKIVQCKQSIDSTNGIRHRLQLAKIQFWCPDQTGCDKLDYSCVLYGI